MTNNHIRRSVVLLALAIVPLAIAACDSSSDLGNGEAIRITGVVTDDAAAKAQGEVEDADVRARKVDPDGDTEPAGGSTTTDSQGQYELAASSRTELMLVTAVRDGFETRTMVDTRSEAGGEVGAVSMTSETRAEADVFLEIRGDGREHVGLGEVALWITAVTAARMDAGAATAAELAAAVGGAEEARRRYLVAEHAATAQVLAAMDADEEASFRAYQTVVSGSTSGSVHANAGAGLRAAVATSGNDLHADARSREAARAALVVLYPGLDLEVRTALRQEAELSTALATRAAVDAGFQSMGSANAQAVVQAGAVLSEALASADDDVEFAAAWEAYASTVRGHLAAELAITTGQMDLAVGALSTLEATLEASLVAATTVDAVVEAKAAYFNGAELSLRTTLDADTNPDAEIASRLLVLVEVH